MSSKECLKRIDEKNYLTEREHREFLSVIEKCLDRLEKLENENQKLKEIIKDNFGYNEKTKECFFNYNAPVMEEEIREVIKLC